MNSPIAPFLILGEGAGGWGHQMGTVRFPYTLLDLPTSLNCRRKSPYNQNNSIHSALEEEHDVGA